MSAVGLTAHIGVLDGSAAHITLYGENSVHLERS
jgi:hypothetical protein